VTTNDTLVVIAGILAIALVNWWFFCAGRDPKPGPDARRR
jgi:hypothetical protein